MSPEQRERLVEVMARAIDPGPFSAHPTTIRQTTAIQLRVSSLKNTARAAIAAAERAGFRIEVSDDRR